MKWILLDQPSNMEGILKDVQVLKKDVVLALHKPLIIVGIVLAVTSVIMAACILIRSRNVEESAGVRNNLLYVCIGLGGLGVILPLLSYITFRLVDLETR